ncbi:DedA family protein [Herbidospora yilanensis]|uniref:DedA family protein n=1 Tax=Herbidospora yilanensis TaxID=354426 RepID=UPI000782A445|nr:DedA family protein [Herbidospora yilanensis]
MGLEHWLESIPDVWIYVVVGLVIGIESLGIPLPGEIVLVSASLMAAKGIVDPLLVGACATAGAIVGDSIGFSIGHRGGQGLFDRLGRRFPRHFGPEHVGRAKALFRRWGVWAVFFGRFVALLRILAGPLAGALHLPYRRFLVANVLGAIVWAGGTTAVVYYLGVAAERWLKDLSWVALAVVAVFGLATMVWVRRRARP